MSSVVGPSRRRSTAVQFAGNLILMGLSIVQGVILIPLYLSYVGKDMYGAWLAAASTVSLLGMADLGVTGIASQRSGAWCGAEDFKALGAFIVTLCLFTCGVSLVVLMVGFSVAPWLPAWVGIGGPSANDLAHAVRVVVFCVVLMFFVSISGSVLFGLQRPAAHMIGMILGTGLGIAATVLLLCAGWGVMALAAGALVRSVVALPVNICALVSILRHRVGREMLRFDGVQLRDFLNAALWLGPAKTAETFIPQVNNIIIVRFLGPAAVTVFAITGKAAEILVQIAGRFSASLLSGLAHLYGSGDEKKYSEVIGSLFRAIAYIAVLGPLAVLVLNGEFIRLWVGPELYGGTTLTLLICLYGLLKIVRIALYNVVFSRNEIRVTSTASVAEAIVQVGGGVILAMVWGLNGVVLAGILAVTAGGLIQAAALSARMEWRYRLSASAIFGPLAVIGAPALLTILIKGSWPIDSWDKFFVCAASYVFFALILVVLTEPAVFNHCRGLLRRKVIPS